MEIHRTLHFARLFIISQGKHRFQFYVHILILYASAIITCIALIRFRIIGNHNFAIVVHVLVRLLTSFSFLAFVTVLAALVFFILILILGNVFVRPSILLVKLSLQQFEVILFGPLLVADLLAGFRTMIISCEEVRILVDNCRIVFDSTPVISRLSTKQRTVKDSHHIIRFHLNHKIEVLDSTVVIPDTGTKQTTVIMPDKVIGINIQSQIIIAHSTPQIILMESGQSTVYIITRVLRAQMNRTVQIRFRFCIVGLLQANNSPCRPCVRIILIQFESRIKVLQRRNRILLLQRNLSPHQISTCIARRNFQQALQILLGCVIILFLNMRQGQIVPQGDVFRIIMQCFLIILNRPVEFTLTNPCQSTNLICTYYKRIPFDSLVTIRFRSLIILQVHLCQRPEKIRLIQIWLRINYLVEILNRKHVVLKIQRIAGNSHHPLRINLSTNQCGEQQ